MEPRKRAGTLLLLVLPALLAAACSRREGRDAEAGARPRSCRLKAVIDPRPVSLLPYEGIHYADGQLTDAIFSNLVYADHRGHLAPELAQSWEVSADHRVYTFHLRRRVRFHDGRPFTAADVVFTLENLMARTRERYVEMQCIEGSAAFLAGSAPRVSGLRILDDHTVQVRLASEFKYFLPFLAAEYTAILPRGLAGRSEEEFRRQPVGTGPFRLSGSEERNEGGRSYRVFRLERDPGYFAGGGNVGGIDVYTFNRGPEGSGGGAPSFDMVFVTNDDLERLARRGGLHVFNSAPTTLNFLVLNPAGNEELRRPALRQLINCAIDRERLVREVFHNQALPAHSMMPFGLLGHNPYYRLDYARAAALRVQLPPGRIAVDLLTVTKDKRGQVGEFVRRELARYDIDVRVVALDDPFAYFTREVYRTDASVILGGIPDYPAAYHFLSHLVEAGGYYNIRGFSLPAVRARIATLPGADTVSETRSLAWIGAELEREALYVPLYHYATFVALRPAVRGLVFKFGEVVDLAQLEVCE
ncbi:MAG TPA: ABC transporter substrate-binding protein [Candidatus Aminicenantes bacterium]|nr:ABC transporter substrate-binding protein [Candidatus Aminicenantes bacterium]